jgi:16S rRNA (cytidine1402-2'-O)-methyltransferase
MGTLYVVATPIGNLKDISLRALEILKSVDLILCEDTRVTKKLLAHYNIEKLLLSYHQHSKENKMQEIFDLLSQGKNLALVSDAGTPGISDPGNELIAWLLSHSTKTKQLSDFCTIPIVPIPGPSALSALASIAGVPMDKFVFLGYPPHKKGRKKFFEEVAQSVHPAIIYESPYRIFKSIGELNEILRKVAAAKNHSIVVGRELTKQFEAVYRGNLDGMLKQLEREKIRGEFVVVVYQKK